MKIFNTLYAKLSAALVILFMVVGVVFFFIAKFSTDMYYLEITQRLNAPIAMYVANEAPLINAGQVKREALEALAKQAMIINPSVEVYLLNAQGKVLAHALDKKTIRKNNVSLEPINKFISTNAELPLLGDDPRGDGGGKIFSAAAIRNGDVLEGYIYVILAGEKYQALAQSLHDSYVFKISMAAVIACLVFGLTCGLMMFAWLTRRLRSLTGRVDMFWESAPTQTRCRKKTEDEIGRLVIAFDAMFERIQSQIEQIHQTDQTRRELIANFSHDLRTPLATMQGYIQTLLLKHEDFSAEQRHQYLEVANKHGVRLERLVAGLFELAKLESNAVKPYFEQFSLAELVNDIAQEFRLSAGNKEINIYVESNNNECIVHADIGLIERVFQNLIENALRHTQVGGEIKITLAQTKAGVQVSVSDNGCGIAEEALPHIFDRFYHFKSSLETELESTGLGLAIVKRILDLHQACIDVQSRVNNGASFSFSLGESAVVAT